MIEFDKSYIPRVRDLSMAGLSDAEIGRVLGLSKSTLLRWAELYPEFEAAWKDGKLFADTKVVNALFKRACGYTAIKWKETDTGIVRESVDVAPDVKACIFWLTNRRPGDWVDKVEHDIGGQGKVIGDNLNDVEAARRIAFALSKAMVDQSRGIENGTPERTETE